MNDTIGNRNGDGSFWSILTHSTFHALDLAATVIGIMPYIRSEIIFPCQVGILCDISTSWKNTSDRSCGHDVVLYPTAAVFTRKHIEFDLSLIWVDQYEQNLIFPDYY